MKTYAYIDAANLFYGGEKSLGWRIDYEKLKQYLENKYGASKIYYFAGIEIEHFYFDYINQESVPIKEVKEYLVKYIEQERKSLTNAKLIFLDRHLKRVRFYKKLEEFGYVMVLKPIKTFTDPEGNIERKANCDVDMAFYMMRDHYEFDRTVVLSGDGDFLPVLKFIRKNGKEVHILSRRKRTSKEVKKFAGGDFRDFEYLRTYVEFEEKKQSS